MPTYTYQCTECADQRAHVLKIADRDKYVGFLCESCEIGTRFRAPEAPGFTNSESLGRVKAPADFRNFLSEMKKAHPGSTIKER